MNLYSERMDFASSPRSTLGIEWEVALVDPDTRELVAGADPIISALDDPRIDHEFLENTIELISGVHTSTDAAIDEMRSLRDAVLLATESRGLGVIGSGTHPFSRWREQAAQPAERYQRMIKEQGSWGQRLVIFGLHNHIGVEDRRKVIPLLAAVLDHLPLILALSASSPFWQGADTQYASHRSMLFQQISTGGIPPELRDWDEYALVIDGMLSTGVVREVNELRWDVRPAPNWGTLEVRIADGAPSLEHVAGVTALTHCLVEEASRALDAEGEPHHVPRWLVRENKWRAARYGLDAEVVVSPGEAPRPARVLIDEAIDRLRPIAHDLGAEDSLDAAARVLANGGSAAQQRERFALGGCPAIVDDLTAQFAR